MIRASTSPRVEDRLPTFVITRRLNAGTPSPRRILPLTDSTLESLRTSLAAPDLADGSSILGTCERGEDGHCSRPGQADITFPGVFTPATERVSAQAIITGYRQLIARAHRTGIRVIGTTLPPFENAKSYTPQLPLSCYTFDTPP